MGGYLNTFFRFLQLRRTRFEEAAVRRKRSQLLIRSDHGRAHPLVS